MVRRILVVLGLGLAGSGLGCTPAKAPRAKVVMREGTTVRTSCPDAPPELADPGFAGPALDGVVIDRICVYGGSADGLLGFAVGDRIDARRVHDATRALVDSSRFEDVELGAERRGEGAILYVSLRERPIVEGTERRLDPYAVAEERKRTVADLVAQGYGAATCEARIEPTAPGRVRVEYVIEKGPLWKIAALVFPNATKLSQRDLEAATGLAVGETYDPDRVQATQKSLLDAYYARGMVAAKVDEPRRDVSDSGAVTLTWNVSEGDVYTVASIKLGKSAPWMQKELVPLIRLKPKMVFDRSMIAADLQRMRDVAEAKHGKHIEISPSVEIDSTKKTVDLQLDVEEKD